MDEISKEILKEGTPTRIESIKIGWKNYKIVYTDEELYEDGEKILGSVNCDAAKIIIETRHGEDSSKVTLIHEVIHAMDDMYNVGLEEWQVEALSNAIYTTIKDNNIAY